jgi:hypothetical protein
MKSNLVRCVLLSVGIVIASCAVSQAQDDTFSGVVNRVWEDGFLLSNTDRSITVDSYAVCGDNTARHITVNDQVTVSGEFEGREFDAYTITKVNGERVCRAD